MTISFWIFPFILSTMHLSEFQLLEPIDDGTDLAEQRVYAAADIFIRQMPMSRRTVNWLSPVQKSCGCRQIQENACLRLRTWDAWSNLLNLPTIRVLYNPTWRRCSRRRAAKCARGSTRSNLTMMREDDVREVAKRLTCTYVIPDNIRRAFGVTS